jgi:DNA-binding IclR family transcriptional regulator
MQLAVRTLRILSVVAQDHPGGATMTEIAEQLSLPAPTAHRILKVLAAEGFLQRDESSLRYFPGEHLRRIAGTVRRASVAELATPHLRSLSDAFQETVFLAQWSGARVVCVALAESPRPLHVTVQIGTELPLHAAASARVLLAHRSSDAQIKQLLGSKRLPQFMPATPATAAEVVERLRLIRDRGYDVCDNELEASVWAISAPVRIEEKVLASLTIAAPHERSSDERHREHMRDALFASAEAVSADLALAGLG